MGADKAETSGAERWVIGFGHVLDDFGQHVARRSFLSSLIDPFSEDAVGEE